MFEYSLKASNKGTSNEYLQHTVELQCLEHLWDHGNLFKTWIVRATEG